MRFCDISPTTYAISTQKEIIKRHLKDVCSGEMFAKTKQEEPLPHFVSHKSNVMIKTGKGVDPVLQQNKVVNLNIASKAINGIVIRPGETFSFCKLAGKASEKRGYKAGRVNRHGRIVSDVGGGLCNLANTIHLLVLDSPLTVTEAHMHSDALAPDHGHRVPLSAGTSVSYNYVDFRFKNETDQSFQLNMWCDDECLHGELRSESPIEYRYEITEDDHHFRREGEKFYRVSKIFRDVIDRQTGELVRRELVWDNHSEVLFDYSEIPADQIRE